MSNFEVQEKLGRLFREGLLKAAQTTGAWIVTAGVDSGVVRQVAQALDEAGISARMRSKIVTIGIAPWGVLKRRERLIGQAMVSFQAEPLRTWSSTTTLSPIPRAPASPFSTTDIPTFCSLTTAPRAGSSHDNS